MNLAEILNEGAPPARTGAVIPDGTTSAAPATPTPMAPPTPLPPSGNGAPGYFDLHPPQQAPAAGPSTASRFASIAKQLAPIISSLVVAKKAGAPAAGAFLKGFLETQEQQEAELKRQALVDTQAHDKYTALQDAKSKELATWLQALPVDASKITDPAIFASFMEVADAVGMSRYHLPKGTITAMLGQHGPAIDKTDVTDAKDLIKTIGPDNLQRGLDAGAVVMFRGKQRPLKEVYALAGLPTDAQGGAVFSAAKPTTNANGIQEGDFIQSAVNDAEAAAKTAGKPFGAVERRAATLQARKEWGNAGYHAPPSSSSVGTEGKLDEDGLDYIATQYRLTRDGSILTRFSEAEKAKVINRVAQQNKTLGRTPAAAIMNQMALKSDAASLTKATTLADASFSFETKANAQADIIEALLPKVARSSWKMLNGWYAAGKVNVEGDSAESQLYNAIQTFSTEYAKIMEGSTSSSAGSTEGARKTSASLISNAMPKGTLADVLALMRKEMDLTVHSWELTKTNIQDRLVGRGDGVGGRGSGGGPGPGNSGNVTTQETQNGHTYSVTRSASGEYISSTFIK